MKNIYKLPEPACILGYTDTQVRAITDSQYRFFLEWMRGQTMAYCDGSIYDHDRQDYVISCDVEHGAIVYPHDLKGYLSNSAITD